MKSTNAPTEIAKDFKCPISDVPCSTPKACLGCYVYYESQSSSQLVRMSTDKAIFIIILAAVVVLGVAVALVLFFAG